MYTIKSGNKTIGINLYDKNYVIGYNSAILARKVQYNINPEPKIILFKNDNLNINKKIKQNNSDINIDININTLYIPKYDKNKINIPINNEGFHLHTIKSDDFMLYPFSKNIGIIIPFKLIEENNNEFIFNAHVIDSYFFPEYFVNSL